MKFVSSIISTDKISVSGKVSTVCAIKVVESDSFDDANFDATKHKDFIEWSQLTPINKDECQDCVALGICGGGCPINAMHLKKGNTIHDLDERFCTHSKLTLDFLIKDLYRIIKEG